MTNRDTLINELVAANRILANEGIVDGFGHVSVRDPENPQRYILARARPPELIERSDIMTFELDGTPVDASIGKPYLERYIHGALYEARPDVHAVVHSHSHSVAPFSVSGARIRPIVHSCATIGCNVPVWDAQTSFGDTNLLISDMAMGRDFANVLGDNTSALMRGHGSTVVGESLRAVVYTAVYLEVNAKLQMSAMQLGEVRYLSAGEIEKIKARLKDAKPGEGYDRAWEYWCRHAGIEFKAVS
ncbi:class II aldolase/adducin family protein [Paraburkholderia sp. ZP32-5]|uniref:class II aldolase/adducin family protein n=1 Tax=Paraburkholderia sp. ZP32-5 TaxID=2883245 RepID=UPI001F434BDD|nr:class II aldolase/adducin family protein [Paraburkholderia sp. ZP32-5]